MHDSKVFLPFPETFLRLQSNNLGYFVAHELSMRVFPRNPREENTYYCRPCYPSWTWRQIFSNVCLERNVAKRSMQEASRRRSRRHSAASPCPGFAIDWRGRNVASLVASTAPAAAKQWRSAPSSEPSAAALSRFFVPFHAYHWPVRHFYNAENPQNSRPQGPARPYFSPKGKQIFHSWPGWPSRLGKWRKKATGSDSRLTFLACFRHPF